jgi:predicted nucleotidyltransferase
MKNLEEIKEILGQVKSLVKEKYYVSELGIFGDYVKGKVQENSEVNILIDYTEPPSLLDLVDLEYYLSDLLKVKADVISKNDYKRKKERKNFIGGYLCMTQRDFRDILQDILEAIGQLEKMTQDISFQDKIDRDLT